MAALLFTTSCGEDTDDIDETLNPTLEITGDDAGQVVFDPGEEVNLAFNFTAPREISSFNYVVTVDGVEQAPVFLNPEVDLGLPANSTEGTINFNFPIPEELAGSEVSILFEVVDMENMAADAVFAFTVNEIPVSFFTTTILFAPIPEGTEEIWFSSETGEKFTSEGVANSTESISPIIDFGYFYGETLNATLASPAAYPTAGQQDAFLEKWNQLNSTQLRKTTITASQFNENREDAQFITAAFDAAEPGNNPGRATNLQAGDVVAFMTDPNSPDGSKSKRGLILVEEVVGTFNQGDNIKIQVAVIE